MLLFSGSTRSIPFCWIYASAIFVLIVLATGRPTSANEVAIAVLRSKGLVEHRNVWISPEEQRLRTELEGFLRLERELQDAQKQFNRIVQHNETLRAQLSAAIENVKNLQQLGKGLQAGTPARKANDEALKQHRELIKELQAQYLEPEKFSASPAVNGAVLQLIEARDGARLAICKVRRLSDALEAAYQQLSQAPEVTSALTKLSPVGTLGPGAGLPAEMQRVDKLENSLNELAVPVFRESGCYRLSAIVNDRLPATFTLRGSSEPTIIPASLAQAAGVPYKRGDATAVHHARDGRKLPATKAILRKLRLGPIVLENVHVLVLPPEGEDLGGQLGGTTLQGLRPKLQPQLLRLQFDPRKDEPADDK